MDQNVQLEIIKAILNLAIALLTLGSGWIVGNRISAKWDERKKRRELDLPAFNSFYSIYGNFFAVWKIWDGGSCGRTGPLQASGDHRPLRAPDDPHGAIFFRGRGVGSPVRPHDRGAGTNSPRV